MMEAAFGQSFSEVSAYSDAPAQTANEALGTKGYIELRKYVDVGRDAAGDNLILVDDQGEQFINVAGQVGFRFFGELILDCLNRTEKAMTQAHAFKAAELCLKAQAAARVISPRL